MHEDAYKESLKFQEALCEKWSKVTAETLPKMGLKRGQRVDFLKGIKNEQRKRLIATLYENAHRWLNSLEEDTRSLQVGSFEKYVFPVIRAAYANLVTADLVSVQPMTLPQGAIYYFDVIYGDTKGNVTAGDRMFDATSGPSDRYHYADEVIDQESIGTGDGATSAYSDSLSYTPIRPGTVKFTDGSQIVQDDANGGLAGDCYSGGTIDYNTGAYDFTFSDAPDSNDSISCTYRYNSEGQVPPQVELQLTGSPVIAKKMALSFKWSIEAQQDLKAYHGMDAETELVAFASNEIQKEINYKIVNEIYSSASAGSVTWEKTPESGTEYYFHKHSFVGTLAEASGLIYKATQRDRGNWMVAGIDVCDTLRTIDQFDEVPSNGETGVKKVGTVANLDVYEAAFLDDKKFVIGRKGKSLLDTGFVYAPYLGVYSTGTIVLDDMVARRGMAVRAADKMVDSGQYSTGQITVS